MLVFPSGRLQRRPDLCEDRAMRHHTTPRSLRPALLTGLALAALAGSAAGQDALGDGRALDRSLQQGTQYNSARQDLRATLEYQNAIVTGNAPGGASFRGDVGYRAPGEFRGALGSDDIFAFRRDSLFSGLAGRGLRGTDALTYQQALTTGGAPPSDLAGNLIVPRDQPSVRPDRLATTQGLDPRQPFLVEVDRPLDPLSRELRSASAYVANDPLRTTMIGEIQLPTDQAVQRLGITGSSLRGLRTQPLDGAAPADPLAEAVQSLPAANRDRREDSRYLDAEQQRQAEALRNLRPGERPPAGPAGREDFRNQTDREQFRVESTHEEILERLAAAREAQAERDQAQRDLADSLRNIRQHLRGAPQQPGAPAQPGAAQQPGAQPRGQQPAAQPGDAQQDPAPPPSIRDRNAAPDDAQPQNTPGAVPLPDMQAELLRRAGEVHNYRPRGSQGDLYAEHLSRGQDLLASGQYIDAEARFARAVTLQPGDPIAKAGRVNAQLGAALYLSAANNLRELLVNHPEMIGVRFSPQIVPSRERLERLVEDLRTNVGLGADREAGKRLVRESALLLAYTGRLLGDERTVREGLDALEQHAPQEQRLVDLLRRVWLDPHPEADADAGD